MFRNVFRQETLNTYYLRCFSPRISCCISLIASVIDCHLWSSMVSKVFYGFLSPELWSWRFDEIRKAPWPPAIRPTHGASPSPTATRRGQGGQQEIDQRKFKDLVGYMLDIWWYMMIIDDNWWYMLDNVGYMMIIDDICQPPSTYHVLYLAWKFHWVSAFAPV